MRVPTLKEFSGFIRFLLRESAQALFVEDADPAAEQGDKSVFFKIFQHARNCLAYGTEMCRKLFVCDFEFIGIAVFFFLQEKGSEPRIKFFIQDLV